MVFINVNEKLPNVGEIVKAKCSDGEERELFRCDCEEIQCNGWVFNSFVPLSIAGFEVVAWKYVEN